jgi:hypothetical protein
MAPKGPDGFGFEVSAFGWIGRDIHACELHRRRGD